MKEKINPVGLKGNQITERMKELMGVAPINENRKTSVIELTKKGPDGNIYGVVRENHEYYIKIATKTENITAEDFAYIGGLQNKKKEAHESYAKAIKHLNLKFNSLNEAYGKSDKINVFEDDNLLEDVAGFYNPTEPMFKNEGNLEGHAKSQCCSSPIMDGLCSGCGKAQISETEESLSEVEQDVEDMMEDEAVKVAEAPVKEHRLSIARSLNGMDDIIESVVKGKKKIYTLK